MSIISRIREEYQTCHNTKKLATELGITIGNLHRKASDNGIFRRPSRRHGFLQTLHLLYQRGLTNREVADHMGISKKAAWVWRNKLGYPQRQRGGRCQLHPTDTNHPTDTPSQRQD